MQLMQEGQCLHFNWDGIIRLKLRLQIYQNLYTREQQVTDDMLIANGFKKKKNKKIKIVLSPVWC